MLTSVPNLVPVLKKCLEKRTFERYLFKKTCTSGLYKYFQFNKTNPIKNGYTK